MLNFKEIRKTEDFTKELNKQSIIDFLFIHLDRFGDSKEAISSCIDYALSEDITKGGFIIAAFDEDEMIGVLIINETGMADYIPENILVYVAVHEKCRGKGYGGQIVKKAFELCKGDIKLHVEYDNPAKRLYERLGFTSKYAEMRYNNK